MFIKFPRKFAFMTSKFITYRTLSLELTEKAISLELELTHLPWSDFPNIKPIKL